MQVELVILSWNHSTFLAVSEPNVEKFIPLNPSMDPQNVVLKSYFGLS